MTPLPVLPTGRNFGGKTQKWPLKNFSGQKNPRLNFWPIFQKMAEKWPNFFAVCNSYKNLHYLQKYTFQYTYENNLFVEEVFVKRPNFLVDLAENIRQELVTLTFTEGLCWKNTSQEKEKRSESYIT
jgi:hypothetical protein